MPTAYSYIRFSTPEQKKGDSLRRQKELSEQYAREHGLTLDTTLHLHDLGVSAFDGSNVTRGALGGFLHAVNERRVVPGSYLLVESLDRLSRDRVMEALSLFLSILNKGITIVTLSDGRVYNADSDNTADLIVSITIMARAHEESLTKSRRLKAAWKNKRACVAEKKMTARCPMWMRLTDDASCFEFIPERMALVREMIGLARNGMGQAAIAKMLNARQIPSFSGGPNGWHPSYIQKILTSPSLYGEYQPGIFENGKAVPHGDPVPNYYPAVVSKDEFYALQSFRSQNAVGGGKAKKGGTVPNLLSGLLKCGYCGKPMVIAGAAAKRIRSEDGKGVVRPPKKVLVCDAGRRGLGCYAVQWGHQDFETSFLSFCRGVDLDGLLAEIRTPTAPMSQLGTSDRLGAVETQIADTNRKIANVVSLIEVGDAPRTILDRVRTLEDELDSLTRERDQLLIEIQQQKDLDQGSEEIARSTRTLIESMRSVDDTERFEVRAALAAKLRRFIESVRLYPAGRLYDASWMERQRDLLIKSGLSKREVNEYVDEMYPTEPKRQGRGVRGRYASRKEIGRFFVIATKNGGIRVVYPDFDDPSTARVDMGVGDSLVAHAKGNPAFHASD
ncbi:recombinase family protein [Paraburkholderia sediminicola]|uniref:recombinase family protein n=1 Tax=Paraburkholderia sediminicola TaxID=458836 RepID=UPI0038B9AA03